MVTINITYILDVIMEFRERGVQNDLLRLVIAKFEPFLWFQGLHRPAMKEIRKSQILRVDDSVGGAVIFSRNYITCAMAQSSKHDFNGTL